MAPVSQQKWLLFIHMVTTAQLVTLQNTCTLQVNQSFAWVGPMPYCVACLIEGLFLVMWNAAEKSSIWFQIASVSPRMLYNAIKHLVKSQTIRPGGIKYDNLPKNCWEKFPPSHEIWISLIPHSPTHSIWLWRWVEHRKEKNHYILFSSFQLGNPIGTWEQN